MLAAKDLINFSIPYLRIDDSVGHAMDLLEEFKLNYLPIISEGKVYQFISHDILSHQDEDLLLHQLQLNFDSLLVNENQPIFEIAKMILHHAQDVFAVVDQELNYLGALPRIDVYQNLIEGLQLEATGGIVEVKTKGNDYPFYDIARLVEQENAHIMSMVYFDDKKDQPSLILKINSNQISYIVLSLERNGYEVISYFSTEQVVSIEKDRYENLMRYLSI